MFKRITKTIKINKVEKHPVKDFYFVFGVFNGLFEKYLVNSKKYSKYGEMQVGEEYIVVVSGAISAKKSQIIQSFKKLNKNEDNMEELNSNAAVSQIMVFVQSLELFLREKSNLSVLQIKEICAWVYSNHTQFKENPYLLLKLSLDLSFLDIDKIAKFIEFPGNSKVRVKACLDFCFKNGINGSAAISGSDLFRLCFDLLKAVYSEFQDVSQIKTALVELLNSSEVKELKIEGEGVFFIHSWYARQTELLVKELKRRNKEIGNLGQNVDVNNSDSDFLSCLSNALNHKISFIAGPAGSGKSYMLKLLYKTFSQMLKNEKYSEKVVVLTPTGKASARLNANLNVYSTTVHSALGWCVKSSVIDLNNYYSFSFTYKDKFKNTKVVLVDESTMLEDALVWIMLNSFPKNCHFVFVGDCNQLTSILPGSFFKDCVSSGIFPTTYLKYNLRQINTDLPKLLNKVLLGNRNCLNYKYESTVVRYLSYKNFLLKLSLLVSKLNNQINSFYTDFQILLAIKNPERGAIELNKFIQSIFIKDKENSVSSGVYDFYVGDKVIQVFNNKETKVLNGELGIIRKIVENKVTVEFQNKQVFEYSKETISELELAYALTVHKAQGSEFKYVVFYGDKYSGKMLNKNLVYTAFSRAKSKLFVFGDIYRIAESVGKENAGFSYFKYFLEKVGE